MASTIDLNENYSWIDERLNELYNGYSITTDNYDEFEMAGLLGEDSALLENFWNPENDDISLISLVDEDIDDDNIVKKLDEVIKLCF
jgi:hypothetical protein